MSTETLPTLSVCSHLLSSPLAIVYVPLSPLLSAEEANLYTHTGYLHTVARRTLPAL